MFVVMNFYTFGCKIYVFLCPSDKYNLSIAGVSLLLQILQSLSTNLLNLLLQVVGQQQTMASKVILQRWRPLKMTRSCFPVTSKILVSRFDKSSTLKCLSLKSQKNICHA